MNPDYKEILSRMGIPAFRSPLHDQDLLKNGEPDKPHYHLMLLFDTLKSRNQIKPIFDQLGGVGCEMLLHKRGYARYLCHLDEKEKVHYDVADVEEIGCCNYQKVIFSPDTDVDVLDEMIAFIDEYQIFSFAYFCKLCSALNVTWLEAATKRNTYFLTNYIKSKYYEYKHPDCRDLSLLDIQDGKVVNLKDGTIVESTNEL